MTLLTVRLRVENLGGEEKEERIIYQCPCNSNILARTMERWSSLDDTIEEGPMRTHIRDSIILEL